jgi:type VI secretion system secreted protein VgrG
VAGSETINYEEVHGAARQDERISSWTKTQELRTAKQTLRDHSFELPDDNLEAVEPITETLQVGTVTHKLKVGPNTELENYDFPGRYAQRFDGIDTGGGEQAGKLQKIFEDNMRTARIRIEEEAGPGLVIAGQSDCRVLMPGHKFTLGGHFDANGSYVLTEVKHTANIEGTYAQSPTEFKEAVYANNFKCIPFAVPFRPLRRTRKARVRGTQTAVVVGPSGEEIFTDKYGRVKVQFYWDRKGEKNADSSCWIRVASQWAGKQWGGINIPRIGQEVVVVFEEGDPDQPIIVGNVYNAEQMPPYSLPDNKTQSGFKSRSSPGGSAENFNELRFEDKKDAEEIYFHARKDFTRMVQTGNDKLTVEEGNREATISKGDDTTKVSAGKSTLEAATSIELKVGSNTIKIDTTGITINGAMVKVEGSSLTEIKGAMVKIN